MNEELTTLEKILACICHIGWLFFGIGYLIIPFFIWLYSINKNELFNHHCKQSLKVQLLYLLIMIISIFLTAIFELNPIGLVIFMFVITLGFLIYCVMACAKVLDNEYFYYPLC